MSAAFRRAVAPFLALLLTMAAMPSHGYSVQAGQVRDAAGRAVELRGINWFGFETETLAPHGLWARNWKSMIEQLQGAGFNAVRLPLCPAAIRGGAIGGVDYSLNPELKGLDSVQLLDLFVREFDARGMHVLLDHHRPDCSAQSELWYTTAYTERDWVADLVRLAERYAAVPHVLGIDLKNEPHGAATWGSADKTTDWNLAAERAAAAVLKAAPRWLIFVGGIGSTTRCNTPAPHFWGENLEPLHCTPLKIPRDRLVLAPHVYGPDVAAMPYFEAADFPANLPAIWDTHFGRHAQQGYALAIGEFGGGYGHCASAKDRDWQNAFARYLVARGIGSSFFWSLNPNSDQTGGLLQDDWQTFWPDKLALLRHLHTKGAEPLPGPRSGPADGKACAFAKVAVPTPPTPPPPAPPPSVEVGRLVLAGPVPRGAARCYDGEVVNDTGSPIAWRVRLPTGGGVVEARDVVLDGDGPDGRTWARGVGAMATLAPGERAGFRYCLAGGGGKATASDVLRLPAMPSRGAEGAPANAAQAPAATPAPSVPARPTTAPTSPPAAVPTDGRTPGASTTSSVPVATTAPTTATVNAGFRVQVLTESEWAEGYCSRVLVTSTGAQPAAWRVAVPLRGSLRQVWKAKHRLQAATLVAEGEDYNRSLAPGAATDFGFCVIKPPKA